jgi:tetratricopeptide (TPR) repeat protein
MVSGRRRSSKLLPLYAAIVFGLLSVRAAPLCGQDDADAPSSAQAIAAKAAHERGIVAFANGNFRAAIAAFQEADRLWPDPALSYNIARAYEQLRDEARAVNYYRDYMRRAPRAADRDAVADQVEKLLKRLGAPELQWVEFTAHPDGASVWIDNEPVGASPARLQLLTGIHRASFRMSGYRTREVSFTLARGEEAREVEVTLELLPAVSPEARSGEHGTAHPAQPSAALPSPLSGLEETSPEKRLLRDFGVTAMLAGVGAFGGAMVFELMRADAERTAKHQTEQIRYAEALDTVQARQTWARVFAGAGGGLAALGITLMVLSRNRESEPGRTRVTLHCAPVKCRAELSGTF